jgi:hypothetical protein
MARTYSGEAHSQALFSHGLAGIQMIGAEMTEPMDEPMGAACLKRLPEHSRAC